MFKFSNEGGRKTLYIYGTIGEDWWSPEESVLAKDISKELDEITPAPLDIRIDSGGGDVYEGFAIASAIGRYEGDTCTYVDGMAASAASYIALMSDRVVMNDFATVMIHRATTGGWGNCEELRRMADQAEAVDDAIAGIIEKRCSLTLDEVKEAMAAETWYKAEDALAAGMCDEVLETGRRMAASVDGELAARYKNVPEWVELRDDATEGGEPQPAGADENPAPLDVNSHGMAQTAIPAALADASDAGVLGGDGGRSHPVTKVKGRNEERADAALVLGNRVYRRN